MHGVSTRDPGVEGSLSNYKGAISGAFVNGHIAVVGEGCQIGKGISGK